MKRVISANSDYLSNNENRTVGNAKGYVTTVICTPTASCTGIPKVLYKNIRRIRLPKPKYPSDCESFIVRNGEIVSTYNIGSESITIEFDYSKRYVHTTDSSKHDTQEQSKELEFDRFVSTLESAGWIVEV